MPAMVPATWRLWFSVSASSVLARNPLIDRSDASLLSDVCYARTGCNSLKSGQVEDTGPDSIEKFCAFIEVFKYAEPVDRDFQTFVKLLGILTHRLAAAFAKLSS